MLSCDFSVYLSAYVYANDLVNIYLTYRGDERTVFVNDVTCGMNEKADVVTKASSLPSSLIAKRTTKTMRLFDS